MVEVEIGGQRIDRQYGDWMHIWNQLCLTAEQERGYNKMVGQTTQLTYLTDPSFADVDSACAGNDVPAAVCAPRNALPETTLYMFLCSSGFAVTQVLPSTTDCSAVPRGQASTLSSVLPTRFCSL